jgi:outer membrane protein
VASGRVVALVLAAVWVSRAALAEDMPLTLAQALEAASRQNPLIVAARERVAAEVARAESVGRGRWPRFSVSTAWTRTDNPALVFANKLNAGEFTQQDFAIDRLNAPDALSHLQTTLSLEAPIDVFGKIGAQTGARSASGRAAEADLREASATLRLRVVEAYRRSEVARRAVAVTERALAGARSREADMEARVAEGATLRADLLRARARRREREADLADRRGAARLTAATLTRLLGAPPETSYSPIDAAPAPAPLAGGEDAWTARALQSRPSLESARQRVEGAGLGERAEQRTILPDVGVFGQFLDDRNGFSGGGQSGIVGAFVRWTAFDPARGKRVVAASAELRAAREDLRAAQDAVRLEVAAAFRRAETARERHAAAAGGAEEGREALRVIQERRQAGVATLTDELETESASLDAELTEIEAAAEAAIADAALARAAGEL